MFKKILVYLALFLLLTVSNSFSVELFDYATYFSNTGDDVTVGWDAPTDENLSLITYELRIKFVEQNKYIPITTNSISSNRITFKLPKVGHYIVEARTVRTVVNQPPVYSDWATSITSGKIGDQSRSWWLYGKLATPGAIIIGSIEQVFSSVYNCFSS